MVHDASGAVVPEAQVRLASPFGERTTTTRPAGEYLLPNLVVGWGYALFVERTGFRTAEVSELTVKINHRTTANFTLEFGETTQVVDVVGTATEAIDMSSISVSCFV